MYDYDDNSGGYAIDGVGAMYHVFNAGNFRSHVLYPWEDAFILHALVREANNIDQKLKSHI